MSHLRLKFVCALCLLVIGCAAERASSPNMPRAVSRAALEIHMHGCTATHGYDWKATDGIGDRELAPGEREWRQCVYRGVEDILIPHTTFPGLYRQIIDEDRRMTEKIGRGEMTRSERRARLDQLLKVIERKERDHAEAKRLRARDMQDALEHQRMMSEIQRAQRGALDAARAVRALR